MNNRTSIPETLQFHFGTRVYASDGQVGILTYILFEAASRCLTYLAVKSGRFIGKTHYLPFNLVERASDEGIWLKCTQEDVAATPIAEGPGLAYDGHTVVKGQTGEGKLALVAVTPERGELAYIVAQNLVQPGRKTLLSAEKLADFLPNQITTVASSAELQALPPFRSDESLQSDVDAAIADLPFLHLDRRGINLRVIDGVLYMEGNISSALRGDLVSDQAAGVKDLQGIKNNLVGDDILAADIAQALGRDSRTSGQHLGVYPELGVVRLSGSVQNVEQQKAALEIAGSFPGVRKVVNNIVIDPSADLLYVMSSAEGGEAKDLTPGKFTRHTK